MKLFAAPGTISVAVAVALEEAGIAHDVHVLDFPGGEQHTPAYRAMNPKGRVPTLQLDDGTLLTETGAILEFIGAKVPRLMPSNPVQAAGLRAIMYYLASTMHVNHAHGRRAARWAERAESHADMAAKVPENMTENAHYVEDHCLTGPFILGDDLSVADCYLFAVCRWLETDGVDLAPFARIRAFLAAMEQRPSVAAVRAKGIIP